VSVYLGRVNQKLFNAHQLLADIGAASDPRRHQLLLESLLLQLLLACHFHLRHIAAQYQCRDPEAINSIADLLTQLEVQGKAPGEANEIQALSTDCDSWWRRLHDCWRRCFCAGGLSPSATGVTVTEVEGRVPLVTMEAPEEFSGDLGKHWLAALTEMVERQRSVMVEC